MLRDSASVRYPHFQITLKSKGKGEFGLVLNKATLCYDAGED